MCFYIALKIELMCFCKGFEVIKMKKIMYYCLLLINNQPKF